MSSLGKALKVLRVLFDILLSLVVAIYLLLERWILLMVPVSWRAKDVKGQIALVTGGGAGLGRLFALAFAQLGCEIVVWDLDAKGNEETARLIREKGGKATAFVCDVSKRQEVYAVAEKVKKQVGPVSILVNNAGVVTGKYFLECSDEAIQRTFDVNVLAHFWTCKAFLPDMVSRKRGHIVNVASLAGYFGVNKLVDYSTSKFAALGLGETLLQELRSLGHTDVKVTSVCPYFINTGMFEGVRSRIIPMLEPEYVVKRAVNAVLVNDEVAILPATMIAAIFVKGLFSTKGFEALSRATGAHTFMENFVGHAGKKS